MPHIDFQIGNILADPLKARTWDDASIHMENGMQTHIRIDRYTDSHDIVPNVPLSFYSFHTMVGIGFMLILIFVLALWFGIRDQLNKKWFLWLSILGMPLAYIASESGWIVAELGRQPWVIQDLMPTHTAISNISSGMVITTFWLFAIVFTALLIAEIKIMVKQINIGPKMEEK